MAILAAGWRTPTDTTHAPERMRDRERAEWLVAVIIPCFNVAGQIADVIQSIPDDVGLIIAVDDASTDDTVRRIEALGDGRVVLVRRARNGGVGAAVKAGYAAALSRGADICVKMDGDGQMSGDHLGPLIAAVGAGLADYAKGNRFVDLDALRRMPRARLFGNACLSFAGKAASGYWNMLDITNGYTAITASMLRRIPLDQLSDRYFFEISTLIELNIAGARVIDVAMPARYAGERSSMRLGRILLTFPGLLLRGMLRRFYWRYLIEDFGVVSVAALTGIPLLAFGIIFGGAQWIRSVETGRLASAGTVILAALPVLLGFQLLLCAVVLDVLSSRTLKRASDHLAVMDRVPEIAAPLG